MKYSFGQYDDGSFNILPAILWLPADGCSNNELEFGWMMWYFKIEWE